MRRSQGFGDIPQQAKRKMTQDYCGHNASVRTDALLANLFILNKGHRHAIIMQ